MTGWVNGNEYEQLMETFGILPLSDDLCAKLGILPYHDDFATQMKICHCYLAKSQQTWSAVLPVHMQQEHSLY